MNAGRLGKYPVTGFGRFLINFLVNLPFKRIRRPKKTPRIIDSLKKIIILHMYMEYKVFPGFSLLNPFLRAIFHFEK